MKNDCKPVGANQYDRQWMEETWGWDTPEEFIRSKGVNLRPRILHSIGMAELRPGMRILDVGCGRGEVVLYCGRNNIHGFGIDYSIGNIEIANAAKARYSNKKQMFMNFLCEDIKNIQVSETFDRIFLLDLVEHLHDWELDTLFQTCRRLLSSDGELIIHTLPNKWLYDITYKRLLRILLPHLPEDPRSEKEKAIHINEMSINHLNAVLENNGFRCHIWLDNLITRQAKWHKGNSLQDKRQGFYRWMKMPLVALIYQMTCVTPLKLLFANDIFAIAKRIDNPNGFRKRLPKNRSEKVFLSIAEHFNISNSKNFQFHLENSPFIE